MNGYTRQNSTESTLTPKQLEVIQAIAGGASKAEAARRADVDRTTIYTWLKNDPDFEAVLTLARCECADATKARLRELADDAVKTVSEIMKSKEIPAGVRLKAALAVINAEAKGTEPDSDAAIVDKWRKGAATRKIDRGRDEFAPRRESHLLTFAERTSGHAVLE
jgi:transposase